MNKAIEVLFLNWSEDKKDYPVWAEIIDKTDNEICDTIVKVNALEKREAFEAGFKAAVELLNGGSTYTDETANL